MRGIVTFSLRGQLCSQHGELAMGKDGSWRPMALPRGAVVQSVKLVAPTGRMPWHDWMTECSAGLDGCSYPLLAYGE